MADYLTYADIGDQVTDLMDDDDISMRGIIDNVINDTYFELLYPVEESKPPWWLEAKATLTLTDGVQVYNDVGGGGGSLQTDISRILSMSIGDNPLTMIDDVKDLELEAGKGYHDTTIRSQPVSAYFQKNFNSNGTETTQLYLYLTPDAAYTTTYWYEKKAPRLSVSSDVPMLPHFSHPGIIYGVLVRLANFDISIKAGPWEDFYKSIVLKLNNFRMNKHFQR